MSVETAIINYLGGTKIVAKALQLHVSSIYRWRNSIPAKHQVRLLNYAKDHNIDLRPDDFFYPERLQALLAQKDNSQEANSPSCGASDLPQDATRAQSNRRMGAVGNHNNYSVDT